jgi:transposase InsO family protein
VVTACQQRAATDYLSETYQVSERRASRVLDRSRSTLRYRPRDRSPEAPLLRAIQRLARKHPRYGYRRIHALSEREGWQANLKRIHRLWGELKLQRPVRRKKARKRGPKPGTSANSCVNQPARFQNDVWTYDFVADRTARGGTLKWLTLADEYTRECPALHVERAVSGADVRRVLARVVGRRGAPRRIRGDNGSGFIGAALRQWLPQRGTESIPVAPGSPWENGFCESFNSRFRDEFLGVEEFEGVPDAGEKGGWFRREYNTVRPHSSPDYKTPEGFSDECDRGMHGQPPKDKNGI